MVELSRVFINVVSLTALYFGNGLGKGSSHKPLRDGPPETQLDSMDSMDSTIAIYGAGQP